MKDRSPAHVIAHGGMSVLQELLHESHGTFPTMDAGEGVEVAQGEVPGVRRHHIKEAGLWFGVAQSSNSLDLFLGHFHIDKISAVNSH
jgi:hypothetical protein